MNIAELPKLYRPVKIKFSSLRNGLGENMGVIFDIDTMVEHEVMRVVVPSGWKWQIKDIAKRIEWDWCIETDQEILNEIGMDLEDVDFLRVSD